MAKHSISFEQARKHELGGNLKDKIVWSTVGKQSRQEREKNIEVADKWAEFENNRTKQIKKHAEYGIIGTGRIAQKNVDKKGN